MEDFAIDLGDLDGREAYVGGTEEEEEECAWRCEVRMGCERRHCGSFTSKGQANAHFCEIEPAGNEL